MCIYSKRRRVLFLCTLFFFNRTNDKQAWRCHKARAEADGLRAARTAAFEEAAAIMLQAAWRGHQARNQMVRIKASVCVFSDMRCS